MLSLIVGLHRDPAVLSHGNGPDPIGVLPVLYLDEVLPNLSP
jgi:hypothetical protein